MTATTRPTTTEPEPPTPAAALAAPCKECGTTGGYLQRGATRPWRPQGYCDRCYGYKRHHGLIATGPAHPDPLPAIVTPGMLGITPGEIGAHFLTAQAQLWADEAGCILAGAIWRQQHPEQFTTAALARIFGGEPVLAYWGDDAARAA